MVLRERIELSTSPLPRECSTTELPQPVRCGGLLPHRSVQRKLSVSPLRDRFSHCGGKPPLKRSTIPPNLMKPMKQPSETRQPKPTDDRKARLAQELRANLQKRKAQSRQRKAGEMGERSGVRDNDEPQSKA